MAMVKCHECGAEISSQAKTCPKCGAKQKSGYNHTAIICTGISVIFNPFGILGIIGFILSIMSLVKKEDQKGWTILSLILSFITTVIWFLISISILNNAN